MKKRMIIGICGFAVVMLYGSWLIQLLSGASAGGTLPTGRSITAFTDSIYISTEMGGDTATIKTSGKTIIVRPRAIVVDTHNIASIDESSKEIEIHVKWGKARILADGRPVNTSRK